MSTTLERPLAKAFPLRPATIDLAKIFIALNCVALLAIAVWMRCGSLANIPGVNGDEAWSGVQAVQALRGEPFAWRTPTGNPVNPFFFGPLLLLHSVFEPSFVVLRSVAVASGLMAFVFNFLLCRRVFGLRAATLSTLLLAVLPINIAYSRFAWDASQTLAVTILVTYLPLVALHDPGRRVRWLSLSLVAFIAAALVHPTNVFTAPLVVVPTYFAFRAEIRRYWSTSGSARRTAMCLAGAIAIVAAAWGLRPWLVKGAERLTHPTEAADFLLNYGRLFSGATVYRYLSGALQGNRFDSIDSAAWCLIAAGLYGFHRLLKSEGILADRALAIATGASALAFFLIAGPAALAPHFERYGIWMVAPGALIFSRGAHWLLLGAARYRRLAELAFLAIAWSLLCGFYANYFWVFERTGGLSHRAFQTAAVEPKMQALEYVVPHSTVGKPVRIVTDEWWSYWPIAYLALAERNVKVSNTEEQAFAPGSNEDTWFVEFSGGPFDRRLVERLGRDHIETGRVSLLDYSGRPALTIYGPIDAADLKNFSRALSQ